MFTLIRTTSYFVFTALSIMALGTPLLAHHLFEAEGPQQGYSPHGGRDPIGIPEFRTRWWRAGLRRLIGGREPRSVMGSSIKFSFCLFVLASALSAASDFGAISGKVTDWKGVPIPRAFIQAKNASGAEFRATSTAAGSYTLTELPVGVYQVSITSHGMKPYEKQNVVVSASQDLRVDARLEDYQGLNTLTATLALPDVAKDSQMKNPQSEDIISTLTTSTSSDQLVQTVKITMKAKISAPIEAVFEALLEEIGPRYQGPNGVSLRLKLEPWPGGRWLRDYGNNTGYFWAQVQSIMPPTLLELYGPMFMSSPVTSQVQFRLTTENSATEISLVYGTLGEIPLAFRDGTHLNERWKVILASVRDNAERRR